MALTIVLHALITLRSKETGIKGKATENRNNLALFLNNCLLINVTKATRLLEIMSLPKLLKQDNI